MPIAVLFLEGFLDCELLGAVLAGDPAVRPGGSKNALSPRARIERRENGVDAAYLRDRDFDYDPPNVVGSPTIDSHEAGKPLGWRWCRHEIENYLIEPQIVAEAFKENRVEFEQALTLAARKIRFYQAARWAVGTARQQLPPNFELRTQPANLSEFELPADLDKAGIEAWIRDHVGAHCDRIVPALEATRVMGAYATNATRFDDEFTASIQKVLLWFSGKNLLAALSDWLAGVWGTSPGAFRATVRDWIRLNPDRALTLLPEWAALVALLRG